MMMASLGGEFARKKAMWLYPKVLGSNPSERWGHSACYSDGAVYVFGGCCGGMDFSDVLVLDLETMVWSTLATTGQGPGPRDSHSAVLVGRQMIVFGGTNGSKKVNDLHVLDLQTKEWTRPEHQGTPPAPRESHTATLIGDSRIMIFGGSGEGEGNYLNDLHVLDLKTMRWSSPETKGDVPVPRDSHGAVAIDNKLFIYGGDCGDRYHGGVDVFDTEMLTWTKLAVHGSSPGVRAGHAAVNIGTKVYVIGGVGDKQYYNDVWILDLISCSWTQLDICGQQPQGRFSHAAVVTDCDITIYGGCGEDERPLNELLVLQLGAEHPNGRYNISMCKIFGNHWNQQNRRHTRAAETKSRTVILGDNEMVRKGFHEPEESRRPFCFASDSPHRKRKRTASSKASEVESEQEEHSLSLSQHSSPSLSDQEQTPVVKAPNSLPQGFGLFRQSNNITMNCHQPNSFSTNLREPRNLVQRNLHNLQFSRDHTRTEQYAHCDISSGRQGTPFTAVELKPMEAGSVQNLVGAEVRGKVDGYFDSGLLMTAAVNGKIFRGVLFAPAPGTVPRGAILPQTPSHPTTQIPIVQPCANSSIIQTLKPSHQPMPWSAPESGETFRKQRTSPVIRAAAAPSKEPKLRSDLQGVVLTLGGPGGGHLG